MVVVQTTMVITNFSMLSSEEFMGCVKVSILSPLILRYFQSFASIKNSVAMIDFLAFDALDKAV